MEVIVKFFENSSVSEGDAPIISRTLGKVAIVSRAYMERNRTDSKHNPMPADQEFWRVHIVKELKPGKREGCFLVQPMEKVDVESLLHLAPGMYSIESKQGGLYVTPNPEYQGRNCIMPLEHKHVFANRTHAYCTIVDVTRPKESVPFDIVRTRFGENPYRSR